MIVGNTCRKNCAHKGKYKQTTTYMDGAHQGGGGGDVTAPGVDRHIHITTFVVLKNVGVRGRGDA